MQMRYETSQTTCSMDGVDCSFCNRQQKYTANMILMALTTVVCKQKCRNTVENTGKCCDLKMRNAGGES